MINYANKAQVDARGLGFTVNTRPEYETYVTCGYAERHLHKHKCSPLTLSPSSHPQKHSQNISQQLLLEIFKKRGKRGKSYC